VANAELRGADAIQTRLPRRVRDLAQVNEALVVTREVALGRDGVARRCHDFQIVLKSVGASGTNMNVFVRRTQFPRLGEIRRIPGPC